MNLFKEMNINDDVFNFITHNNHQDNLSVFLFKFSIQHPKISIII
jgi:hypothetical protein